MGARICCWTRAWLQTGGLSKPAIVLLAYNDHLQVTLRNGSACARAKTEEKRAKHNNLDRTVRMVHQLELKSSQAAESQCS